MFQPNTVQVPVHVIERVLDEGAHSKTLLAILALCLDPEADPTSVAEWHGIDEKYTNVAWKMIHGDGTNRQDRPRHKTVTEMAQEQKVEVEAAEEGFFDDYLSQAVERLGGEYPVELDHVRDLYQKTGGDVDLMWDMLDFAEDYLNHKPIKYAGSFLLGQLRHYSADEIRREAKKARQKKEGNGGSLKARTMAAYNRALSQAKANREPILDDE